MKGFICVPSGVVPGREEVNMCSVKGIICMPTVAVQSSKVVNIFALCSARQ